MTAARPVRVQLLSDAHFIEHRDGGAEFVGLLDPEDVDVLVVASLRPTGW